MSRKRTEPRASDGGAGSPAAMKAAEASEPAPSSEARELEEQMAQLRTLMEHGDVRAARELVQVMAARWPESERVQRRARTLAPPVTRVLHGIQGRNREQERNWLHQHAREYPNHWLAVLGDRLVAAHPDARVVVAAVRQTPGAQEALIHFQPGPSD